MEDVRAETEDAESRDVAGEEQNILYNKATNLKATGQSDEALKYFTKCLEGANISSFTKLPQCLREIAAIYYEKEDYEKAVQFAQAEKLYYEAALIDSSAATAPLKATEHSKSAEDHYVQKAIEYEQLASLCLKQCKIDLALEYCGKVAKIRQSALGPSNPATVRSLDLFTVLYAESGRQQYADALKLARNPVKVDDRSTACIEQPRSEDCKEDSTELEENTKPPNAGVIQDSQVVWNLSSIVCSSKAIFLYFLITSIFALMLSFWIIW